MSNPKYWTMLTKAGRAKIANSIGTGIRINITKFAVGDGVIQADAEKLTSERFRGLINTSTVVESSPQLVEIIGIVPSSVGGFYVREAAFYTEDDVAFAIVKYPETYKPNIADNANAELGIKAIIDVINAESLELKIDPSMVYATQDYVSKQITKLAGLLSLDGGAFTDSYPDLQSLDGGEI